MIVEPPLRAASKFVWTSSGLCTITTLTPKIIVNHICTDCPKLWNSGRFAWSESVESTMPISDIWRAFAIRFLCVRTAAFGAASEPDVKIIDASLSPPVFGIP